MVEFCNRCLSFGLFDPVLRDLTGRLGLVLFSKLDLTCQCLDSPLLLCVGICSLIHLGQGRLCLLQLVSIFLGTVRYSLLLLFKGFDPAVIDLNLPLCSFQSPGQVLMLSPECFDRVSLTPELLRDLLGLSVQLLQVRIDAGYVFSKLSAAIEADTGFEFITIYRHFSALLLSSRQSQEGYRLLFCLPHSIDSHICVVQQAELAQSKTPRFRLGISEPRHGYDQKFGDFD